jgi:hypothetical protein
MHNGKKFGLVLIVLVLIGSGILFAQSEISGNVKLIGSTAPPKNWINEAKAEIGYTVKFPFLQGEGPLFSGNNIKVKGILGVTPITASLTVEGVITPIAVLELSVGGALGTGWNFDLMGLEGLRKWDGTTSPAVSDTMHGMYYKAKGGAALQFDTAAIWPGDWTSVVLRTYHEINYQGYTNFSGTVGGWEFETAGLHQNGINYKGEYLVGYQMPLVVDTVAIMLETYLDNIGTNLQLPQMVFDLGLVANFGFSDRLNLTIIPQMTTKVTDPDTRVMSEDTIKFKRVAAMLNYAL